MKNFTNHNESVPSSASQFFLPMVGHFAVAHCPNHNNQALNLTQFEYRIQCNPFCPKATKLIHHVSLNIEKYHII